jgi:predicted HD superfamily hydrolase involved in NAD metabolism
MKGYKKMWSEQFIEDYLRTHLNVQRYEHSLRVRDTAVNMAEFYKVNIEKARLAGLVHDCAKDMSGSQLRELVANHGYSIDEVCKYSSAIMHGLGGAIIAKEVMGIEDADVLNAVTYHTTGRENMSVLEKIIYLADYIEPMRNFPMVEKLRELSYKSLDEALLLSFNNTINYIIARGQLLHYDTIDARNYLLIEKMR